MSSQYEVYALKYAHHARRAAENFIGGDPHDGPMPLDYFVWLIRSQGREIVVDTGFSAAMAAKRGRNHLRCPTEGLKLLGTDSNSVREVIITHLHYDHVGNFDLFPAATLHLQDLEMRYATGRYMAHDCFRGAYEVEDVVVGTPVNVFVRANDFVDPDTAPLTVVSVTQPSFGTAQISGDGTYVIYTATTGFRYGSFQYTVADTASQTSTATVRVYALVTEPPEAGDDYVEDVVGRSDNPGGSHDGSPDDPRLAGTEVRMLGTMQGALQAAADFARKERLTPIMLGDLEGEAREVRAITTTSFLREAV